MHVAIQRANYRCGDHPFRRAADAVHHVDFAIRHAGQDRGGNVAVGNREYAHTQLLQLDNHLVVTRLGKNGNG